MEFTNTFSKELNFSTLKLKQEEVKPLNSTSANLVIDYNKKRYSKDNPPRECMMTNSSCYLNGEQITPKGIIIHSTGINNPYLKRYVQPSKSDVNYNQLIDDIGLNSSGNDFNHSEQKEGYNAWIGKLANGTVTSLQTMPWTYRSWGSGFGRNGTCEENWIQIIICEDLTDVHYFTQIYNELCALLAYICELYKINPDKYILLNNQSIPTILSHQECGELGLGTKFTDVKHWFDLYNKTMGNVKYDVSQLLIKKVNPIENLKGTASYLIIQPPLFEPYEVRITAKRINIRSGPGIENEVVEIIKRNKVVKILEEQDGWGKIDSGWINLKYAHKLSED